jgi:hypothetical protein
MEKETSDIDRVCKWIANSSGTGIVMIGFIDKKSTFLTERKTSDFNDCKDVTLIIR